MKKPPYITHYLFLRDLIALDEVCSLEDKKIYLTSRLSNTKLDLKERGLEFVEDIEYNNSKYATYKPYKLLQTKENLERAKKVLASYETPKVLEFVAYLQR